jgi:hypothetical protein
VRKASGDGRPGHAFGQGFDVAACLIGGGVAVQMLSSDTAVMRRNAKATTVSKVKNRFSFMGTKLKPRKDSD